MFSINTEERDGKQTRNVQTNAAMLIPPQTRAKVQKQPIGEAAAANHCSSAEPPLLIFLELIPIYKVK